MFQNKTIFLYLLIFLLFTCKSNKEPLWVTDPPLDDELNIYIVGIGNGESVYKSVLKQIYDRFKIPESEAFSDMIITLLKDETDDNISIIDSWSSKTTDYILVRIKRSFFDPIIKLYTTRYSDMINFTHENVAIANDFMESGEYYKAYKNYLTALKEMLSYNDEFYTPAILNVISKIKEILGNISYLDITTFSNLVVGKPVGDKAYGFKVIDSDLIFYDGFTFEINFYESWENRKRSAILPIRQNSINFVPTTPKISGESTISSTIVLDGLFSVIESGTPNRYLTISLEDFSLFATNIVESSLIEFTYNVTTELNTFVKLISFENSFITEGITRYLLESEIDIIDTQVYKGEESLLTYVRDINSLTKDRYKYLIIGDEIKIELIPYDSDGQLIRLEGTFLLVDMETAKIIQTQSLKSEFIGVVGEENLAFLDYGLKVGEVISTLKF